MKTPTPFDQKGFSMECGLRLAVVRKSSGITQEKLAKSIGVTRSQLANIEAGRSRMYLDVVWRSAIVLGVRINKLIPERA